MSPALLFLGISVVGTWGLASIGLIAGGLILIFAPGSQPTASDGLVGGLFLVGAGAVSAAFMGVVIMPLMGLDPPIPVLARSIVPESRLTRWVTIGPLRDFPDGLPKEVRVRSRRVVVIRDGDSVSAMSALCSHARSPLAGFPASPIRPLAVKDGCVTCPFHGAQFMASTGRVVRQPFTSEWNNEHAILGRAQSGLFKFLAKIPAPKGKGVSMKAEDMQTYPARVEDGEVAIAINERS